MKRIFKYPLSLAESQKVSMPGGAHILTLQLQNGQPFLWALVEDNNAKEVRAIRTLGTGHPVSEDATIVYIGSYQMDGGALVWHVFEDVL